MIKAAKEAHLPRLLYGKLQKMGIRDKRKGEVLTMFKVQMSLIALLIGCLVFISCDAIEELLTASIEGEGATPTDEMLAGLPADISMYNSWTTHVSYPGP